MPDLATLAGEIAIVLIFIWYLKHRDQQTRDLAESGHNAVNALAKSFADLKEVIAVQNELLRRKAHDPAD